MSTPSRAGEEVVAERKSVLLEAEEIINGQRRKDYGGPLESFSRIAAMWTAYLKHHPRVLADGAVYLEAEDVAMMMVMLKISRAQQGWHRDSLVDGPGYFGCVELIQQERAEGST